MNWIKNLRRKQIIAVIAGVLVSVVAVGMIVRSGSQDEPEVTPSLPAVQMTSASKLTSGSTISLVGSVRAFTEAAVTAERGGRVTSVNARLGDRVAAGAVLVTLENSSESAAVLQAEGAYDAAVAAAAQSDIGPAEALTALNNAQNNTVASLRTAYSTVDSVIRNNVDQFFADPNSPTVPGLRINGEGYTSTLNAQRVEFRTALPTWESRIATLSTDSDLKAEILYANSEIERAIEIVSTFISVFNEQETYSRYTEAEIASFGSSFGTLRNNLIALQSQLKTAGNSLDSAADALRRAELAASGGSTSAADAQVKQALGALRAAQANYAKTIMRAPVAGTVNELPVRVGDFIAAQTKVAEVANNNALEIVTYASDAELFALQPGDVVTIEGQYEGVITTIAPAVDSVTGKTEVRIASENANIKNGDTVRISSAVTSEDVADTIVRVPLAAVKFEREDGFMFTVRDGVLVRFPVTLGSIFGGEVTIERGLSITDEFVTDARGLREGDAVEVVN